jgi:uncharacterized protein
MESPDFKAWYLHAWPWVLISIPFSAVLFGIVMFVMANIHRDDLVADDYYEEGMAINRQLTRDELARQLGIYATWKVSPDSGIVFKVYNAKDSAVLLYLQHVSDSQQDRSAVLVPGDGFDYSSDDERVARVFAEEGVWYLGLEGTDDTWRLRKRLVTPVTELELRP